MDSPKSALSVRLVVTVPQTRRNAPKGARRFGNARFPLTPYYHR
jgi:hypothetical protein